MNRKERRAQGKQGGVLTPPPRSPVGDLFQLAAQHHRAGRIGEAETLCRQVLALDPRHDDGLHLLGVIAHQSGHNDAAIDLIGQAIAINRRNPAYHANLGIALQLTGRPAEAVESFRRAVTLDPKLAVGHFNMGNAYREQNRLAEAAESYDRAIALQPAYAEAHYNLGIVLHLQRRFGAAAESYGRALAAMPDFAAVHSNLGYALQEQGRQDEAVTHFLSALAHDPKLIEAETNLILTLLYRPGTTLADIRDAAVRWNARHADNFRGAGLRGAGLRGTGLRGTGPVYSRIGAKPRIGFVSGDFRQHVVGNMVAPTLEALARRGHEIACYHNSSLNDGVTARFKAAVKQWRSIPGQTDQAVADLIRADAIDILFDLSGMTGGNRLTVFARKPAPVQVAWFGYPATTGLAAMDYLLADAHQVPDGADGFYSEKIVRLPDSYICYEPPADAPGVTALPRRANGFVTFGSFNEPKKIAPETIAVWSRVLAAFPDARLLLKARNYDDPAIRDRHAALFADHGIGRDRLEFMGWTTPAEHMAVMARADIALDSFPYTGGATTLDTLWMGIPVVALPGETLCSRHSTGYLTTLGMTELIARDADDYVRLATGLARDPARLEKLRAVLRGRVAASSLCDVERFADRFEAALGAMWKRYLSGEPAVAIEVAETR